ncbi:hypothetical protein CHRYSEOSP005_21760 [Chryseobacterium sp. Alg-005]|uniref:T9SS type A sorting domain-containing protein n=1 Tax=Chryseobacterium sp. Alg-005 TaxID=3159516 RepID=UPI003555B33F
MKKLYFIFTMGMAIGATAQSTVTRAGLDRVNVTMNVNHANVTNALSPGPSGANITWDFSSYTPMQTISISMYSCPGQTNCFRFPAANRMSKLVGSENYDYNLFTDMDASVLGNYSNPGDATMTYTDPLIQYKFPVSYLQEFTDTYQFSTGTGTESGTQTFKVDGYGTVITPTGTFTNCLRIKRVRNGTQTFPGSPPMSYVNESYQWVNESVGIILSVAFNTFTINGTTTTQPSLAYYTTSSLSTADLDHVENPISVYPNPSSDLITLQSKDDIKKMNLTNAEGKLVLKTSHSKTLNISGLPNGVYLLQGELKNGKIITKKVVKK